MPLDTCPFERSRVHSRGWTTSRTYHAAIISQQQTSTFLWEKAWYVWHLVQNRVTFARINSDKVARAITRHVSRTCMLNCRGINRFANGLTLLSWLIQDYYISFRRHYVIISFVFDTPKTLVFPFIWSYFLFRSRAYPSYDSRDIYKRYRKNLMGY